MNCGSTMLLKSIFDGWRSDPHMQEILTGASLAFVLKLTGALLGFAFNVAVARLLGAEGVGVYFLALSVVMIGSVIGRVGLDNTLLRLVSIHATHADWSKVRAIHNLGLAVAATASSAVTVLAFVFATGMAVTLFDKPVAADPLRWMSLAIIPFALLNLEAESLKGLKRIRDAMLVQGVSLPLIGLMLIWPAVLLAEVSGAAWAYVVSATLVAAMGMWLWRRAMPVYTGRQRATFSLRELTRSCIPLFVTSVMHRAVLPWAPVFLLGIWGSSEAVGIFGASTRVAMIVSLMLATINNVMAPKLAELYAIGDVKLMGSTARRSALLVTILASPIFVLMIFAGEFIMALFGPNFREGGILLAILATGQFINCLTGSVNHFLIVTGNERAVRNMAILMAALQVSLGIALIPHTGATGAAIAVAISTAGFNIGSTYIVWRRFGVVTIPFLQQ